jgi:lysyl-tRNA synthetase class 2
MDINWAIARKKLKLAERARIIQSIRAFFVAHNFLEVETPQRIQANAPEPHIDAVASDNMWLQTSPELAMKRLLAAGYGDIFQICKVWRDGEKGTKHLPEFTMLEWYRANADYHQLMADCERLLQALVPSGQLNYQGQAIELTAPWPRITVNEAFDRYANCSVETAIENDTFEEILTDEVEPKLGLNPLFLTEYPKPLAALARTKQDNPAVAERCELYIGGMEMSNGFSELADPVEQRERFEEDERIRQAAGKPPYPMPEGFLRELEQMPESAGMALGIDRLIMLLTDTQQIDEVVAFTPADDL